MSGATSKLEYVDMSTGRPVVKEADPSPVPQKPKTLAEVKAKLAAMPIGGHEAKWLREALADLIDVIDADLNVEPDVIVPPLPPAAP